MAASGDEDRMLARVDGAVGHMVFNNPEKHNAVSLEMWDMAEDILQQFADDETVRVVVLSGAGGRSFVSGADISKFDTERSAGKAAGHYNDRVRAVYERIEHFSVPTIAMIDGYCIGGGLNLAVACDIRIASEKSTFAMPAARLGLGFPFHAVRRLVHAVGAGRAKDLMFSGRRIDAGEAARIGLVQQVVPDGELTETVDAYAAAIARNAPLTIAVMKYAADQVMLDPEERDLARADEMVARCYASEDYEEGRNAFREKRDPEFRGR